MRVGRHGSGEYHLEILPSTRADCQAILAYRAALHAAIGVAAAERLEAEVAPHLPELRKIAEAINPGLTALVGRDFHRRAGLNRDASGDPECSGNRAGYLSREDDQQRALVNRS